MRSIAALACCALVVASCGVESTESAEIGTVSAIDTPTTIPYGSAPEQFGVLSLPTATPEARRPVVVLIHGGFWRNQYALELMTPLADDLVGRGYAVWNLEYRRVGDEGGGWQGTLEDVATGIDALAALADDHQLDLDRVAVVGHSAGGHLALWAAGRSALPADAPGADPVVTPAVAVGQGAVVDLTGAHDAGLGGGAVANFLGGSPSDVPDRYQIATPRFDAGPHRVSVVGTADDVVPPPFSTDPERPDLVELVEIAGADHFDLIDPAHEAWAAVIAALER